MRNILYIAIIITTLYNCTKEPIINFREGMGFDPDTIIIEPTTIAWELYTWENGDVLKYSLMPGTNRARSANEIYANPYAVNGQEQLKLVLRRLPSEEKIIWYGTEWTKNNLNEISIEFIMPSLLTQYDINEFCELKSLALEFEP